MIDLVALGRHGAKSALVTRDGELVDRARNILLLFRPAWAGHDALMRPDVRIFDLAELWAFVRPGAAAPPTVFGMTGQNANDSEESAVALYALMDELLAEAASKRDFIQPWINAIYVIENTGWTWPWLDLLPPADEAYGLPDLIDLLKGLPKWTRNEQDGVHEPALQGALRDHQDRYFQEIQGFLANDVGPQTLLAVGGTGVGKTRAYLAAGLGAQKKLWVSTFTKALQSQVQHEAARHLGVTARIRKGRDNYMCLRLLAEAWQRLPLLDARARLALVTMSIWTLQSPDGDMTGTGFPGWLTTLYGAQWTMHLADRLRECIYQACPFYAQCFVEGAKARSLDAPLVIANHAVVASQSRSSNGMAALPPIVIMDEAHHVESVMDDALTTGISLAAAVDLRRFLLGVEARGKRRGRKAFLDTLVEALPDEDRPLLNAIRAQATAILPDIGALDRWKSGVAANPLETWLQAMYQSVQERLPSEEMRGSYDWEMPREAVPPYDPELRKGIATLLHSTQLLLGRMEILDREASLGVDIQVYDPKRDVLENQAILPLRGWITQLDQLVHELPDGFIEWASIQREEGQMRDIGLFRAWMNPLKAWQGSITAAPDRKLVYATATPGPALLNLPDIQKTKVDSPFDYSVQARVFILTDLENDKDASVAAAMAPLMAASGGGALAIFTAIARLKRVYHHLDPLCRDADLHLLAQHIDEMDVATLVDLLRTEPRCALLGTDAVRDGVDIPGEALRLLIFDRVPWPRPSLVHRARREHYGGRHYDEDLVKLKLKQGFGRLIRTPTDRGAFVMLDSRLPSRLYDAFPEGVAIERVTLAEAIERLGAFFKDSAAQIEGRTGTGG